MYNDKVKCRIKISDTLYILWNRKTKNGALSLKLVTISVNISVFHKQNKSASAGGKA